MIAQHKDRSEPTGDKRTRNKQMCELASAGIYSRNATSSLILKSLKINACNFVLFILNRSKRRKRYSVFYSLCTESNNKNVKLLGAGPSLVPGISPWTLCILLLQVATLYCTVLYVIVVHTGSVRVDSRAPRRAPLQK